MDSGLNISQKSVLVSGCSGDSPQGHYPKQSEAKFFLRAVNTILFEIKKKILKSFNFHTPRKLLSERRIHADLPVNKSYFECQAKIQKNLKLFNKAPILRKAHEKAHPNHFLFDPSRDIKPELMKHITSALDKNINYLWVLKIDKNNNPVLRIGFEHEVDGMKYGHPTLIDDDATQFAIIGGELFYDHKNQCWSINNYSGRYGHQDSSLMSSLSLKPSDLMDFVADQFEKYGIPIQQTVDYSVSFGRLIKGLIKKAFTKQALATAKPSDGEDKNQWVTRVLRESGITANKKYAQRRMRIEVSPEQLDYFVELQEVIARKIPHEAHRPTIDLFIRGKKAGDHTKACTLGLLGGVGPLSDAYVMKRAFQNLKKQSVDMDHMVVNVLSCPPPRTAIEIIKYGSKYVKNLRRFGARKHNQYAIASNTAHINFSRIKLFGIRPLKHIVYLITENIKRKNAKGVLVLGTTQAHWHKLYPRLLKGKKLKAYSLSADDQIKMQEVIDKTKMLPGDIAKQRLISLIEQAIARLVMKGTKPSHILLGCTELPLALGKRGIKKISRKWGVTVVDSEREIAKQFSKMLHKTLAN